MSTWKRSLVRCRDESIWAGATRACCALSMLASAVVLVPVPGCTGASNSGSSANRARVAEELADACNAMGSLPCGTDTWCSCMEDGSDRLLRTPDGCLGIASAALNCIISHSWVCGDPSYPLPIVAQACAGPVSNWESCQGPGSCSAGGAADAAVVITDAAVEIDGAPPCVHSCSSYFNL